jgi:hypothetical protein
MTLTATIAIDVNATKAVTSGLTSAIDQHPLRFSVDAGDCTKVWSDRRTVGAFGYDDIDFSAAGISTVKVLFVKNLAATDIALSAGWGGSDFRNFIVDSLAWNFSPMVNLGSLSLRGMPIRAGGSYMVSCPNSSGFSTLSGGSLLRIGGQNGAAYEIYVLGN